MKQISILALTALLTLTLIGCGRKEESRPADTMPSTAPEATMPQTTLPIDPTIDTNIPDPTVDSNSNQTNDNTTGATEGNSSRISKHRKMK